MNIKETSVTDCYVEGGLLPDATVHHMGMTDIYSKYSRSFSHTGDHTKFTNLESFSHTGDHTNFTNLESSSNTQVRTVLPKAVPSSGMELLTAEVSTDLPKAIPSGIIEGSRIDVYGNGLSNGMERLKSVTFGGEVRLATSADFSTVYTSVVYTTALPAANISPGVLAFKKGGTSTMCSGTLYASTPKCAVTSIVCKVGPTASSHTQPSHTPLFDNAVLSPSLGNAQANVPLPTHAYRDVQSLGENAHPQAARHEATRPYILHAAYPARHCVTGEERGPQVLQNWQELPTLNPAPRMVIKKDQFRKIDPDDLVASLNRFMFELELLDISSDRDKLRAALLVFPEATTDTFLYLHPDGVPSFSQFEEYIRESSSRVFACHKVATWARTPRVAELEALSCKAAYCPPEERIKHFMWLNAPSWAQPRIKEVLHLNFKKFKQQLTFILASGGNAQRPHSASFTGSVNPPKLKQYGNATNTKPIRNLCRWHTRFGREAYNCDGPSCPYYPATGYRLQNERAHASDSRFTNKEPTVTNMPEGSASRDRIQNPIDSCDQSKPCFTTVREQPHSVYFSVPANVKSSAVDMMKRRRRKTRHVSSPVDKVSSSDSSPSLDSDSDDELMKELRKINYELRKIRSREKYLNNRQQQIISERQKKRKVRRGGRNLCVA